jgi:hypothetical protein
MEVSGKLHTLGKEPRYPLNKRLGGPQSRSGRFGEEILVPARILTPARPPRSLVTILRSAHFWDITDVSGQRVGSIFTG